LATKEAIAKKEAN
jgi:hypothetical protein